MQTAEKLRPFGARDKIGYAMGDLGCNLSFQLISSYMFLFYTQCIGLTTTNWAWIIVVSKIWDAVNDIIIGGMVDRHRLSKKVSSCRGSPSVRWGFWLFRSFCFCLCSSSHRPARRSGAF